MDETDHSARVGSELVPKLRVTHVLATTALGASLAAESAEHGAVVVDLLNAEHSAELGALFVQGARRAAMIDHPAAIPVLSDGMTPDNEAYVLRPRWEGETAKELIRRRPARIPPVEALRLAADLLDVVARAHAAGMVHGAISPAEVFIVDDGSVRLLGLGWEAVRRRVAVERGALSSPVAFAAPEHIAHPTEPASEKCDVWSVGAVLFALLTGEAPYDGKTDSEQRASALERPPRTLTELFGESSLSLARLVDTALDPDPSRRLPPARMRVLVREVAQLPELFLLRDLRSQQSPSPISGPRRSPSAELATRETARAAASPATFRVAETIPAMIPIRSGMADTIPAMPRVESPAPSIRRRRVADVLVGEATSSHADVRVLTELCQRLERAIRARLRDPELAAEALADFAAGARAALAASSGGFVWNVAPWGFVAGTHAIWEPAADICEVSHRLYRDGVRSFGLLPGVSDVELATLVEVLALADAELAAEDDRATLLGSSGFEHVIFRTVDVPAAEPAERRLATARQRQHIALLAAFDTSAQLEDCWRDAHAAGNASELEGLEAPGSIAALGDGARRELEARFSTEARESADRIARVATAALNVARQAGAEARVRAHLQPQKRGSG